MKIKNTLKIGSLLLLSLMLFACKGKDKPTATDLVPVTSDASADASALEGTWTYACTADPDSQGDSLQQTQKYTGNKLVLTVTSNKGLDCKVPLITSEMAGDFTIGKAVDDHSNIARTAHHLVVTIRDQATVDMANNGELADFGFGLKDWKLNVPKDLTGNKLAVEYYSLNSTELDIFKIENNKLYTGDLNGDIVNNRPTTLNMSVWGTRK